MLREELGSARTAPAQLPAPEARLDASYPSPAEPGQEEGRSMRKISKRALIAGIVVLLVLVIPALGWLSLTHQPGFYRTMVRLPRAQREARAKRFIASSLQLS